MITKQDFMNIKMIVMALCVSSSFLNGMTPPPSPQGLGGTPVLTPKLDLTPHKVRLTHGVRNELRNISGQLRDILTSERTAASDARVAALKQDFRSLQSQAAGSDNKNRIFKRDFQTVQQQFLEYEVLQAPPVPPVPHPFGFPQPNFNE